MRRIAILLSAAYLAMAADPIRTLLVDGQNNHDWKATTPVLKKQLEETGLFQVDVITTPPKGADMNGFLPDFSAYKLVVSNYNGDPWPEKVKAAFEKFVRGGGGFVSYHAANNAFPEWPQYNEMIGLGGWGGRSQKSGGYARWRDGEIVLENKAGPGGHHGKRHEFVVTTRNPSHPIMKGLSAEWLHAEDELYDCLRGPAKNLNVLATAYSDPATNGTGENEPMLLALPFGKGRVFHTTLGHDLTAIRCVGFATTFQRGAEWAATGKVTQKAPVNFPAADRLGLRKAD